MQSLKLNSERDYRRHLVQLAKQYRNIFSTPPANAYIGFLNSSSSLCCQKWEGYIFFIKCTHTHTHTHRTGLEMVSVVQSCLILCNHRTRGQQAPLSMQFPRQEQQSGLPFPTLGDLPDPGIRDAFCISCISCTGRQIFSTEPPGKSNIYYIYIHIFFIKYIYTHTTGCNAQ